MVEESLIIFAKNPVAGNVKTRLAKDIGEEEALNVYKWLLDCTYQATKNLTSQVKVYFDQFPVKSQLKSLSDYPWKIQHGIDLGEKMKNAFQNEFEFADKVVIIGSDCPDLTNEHIQDAFDKLKDVSVVLGPAKDGGYYLLGLSTYLPELLDGINWSTATVLTETIRKVDELNLNYKLLDELSDIDSIEDLKTNTTDVRHVE